MSFVNLTPAQIQHFDTEGYLVLRHSEHGLVSPSELHLWTDQVRNLPRESQKWMPYDEISASGERQIMRTENFVDFHAGFASLLHGKSLMGILAQLTRDDMRLFKEKINYKLPGGNGFAAHLDAPAYDHIGKIEHTTANIAVDAATVANGCVEVVAGSHRKDVELVDGTGEISAAWEAQATWIPVELEEGDLLIFGSHLAHRSKKNTTSRPRASVYATYHNLSDGKDLREKYYEDRRINFPPDHGMLFQVLQHYVLLEILLISCRTCSRSRLQCRCEALCICCTIHLDRSSGGCTVDVLVTSNLQVDPEGS
jgi:hypothetical protein